MILQAFKEKTNKVYINKLLDNRLNNVDDKKVRTVAVLLNNKEFNNAEAFHAYFKELGLNSPKNKVVYFSEIEEKAENRWQNFYTKKDFGWSGKIKNQELVQFLEESYDVVIGYYSENISEMHQIIAMSKANLKVGVHNHDERLFDIIFNMDINKFDVFKRN